MGATDSAAPCAMLLHIARVLEPHLARMYEEMSALGEGGEVDMDMGVQVLFLDGEEAWGEWSGEDSLYGSRYVNSLFLFFSSLFGGLEARGGFFLLERRGDDMMKEDMANTI